ncbi:MAG: thymidylate synthase [Candidatus Omnitrophica bacterium]|nr:thymidylate synthase [Candidatus Omnitrophota bacterium]
MTDGFLKPVFIDAFDLDDAWFQCLTQILDHGCVYTITRGSYEGQKRLGFDFVTVRVRRPSHQIIPIIPEGMNIPAPTDMEYVQGYLSYLLTGAKTETEDYTYGERLVDPKVRVRAGSDSQAMAQEIPLGVNQVEAVIGMYRKQGHGTNQATMEIGMPSDIALVDPPCLRLVDTRIRYGKLHFVLYFRSWDLWGGFPSNLGGLQLVKNYMADEIGVEDGEIIAVSKGMHLYDYSWDLAKLRTGKNNAAALTGVPAGNRTSEEKSNV